MDGWIDTSKRALVNTLVSCCYGTMYHKTIVCSGVSTRVDGPWFAEILSIVLKDANAENVVQLVTDNASDCVSIGHILEAQFPSLVWTPCASHCQDLLLEDIGKLSWVYECTREQIVWLNYSPRNRIHKNISANIRLLCFLGLVPLDLATFLLSLRGLQEYGEPLNNHAPLP